MMFANSEAFSGFAVPDLDAASRFYGETLGLTVTDAGMGGLLSLKIAGSRDVLVYLKPDHTPATYTILNFPVEDIDAAVDALVEAGVSMERYGGLDADEKGIVRDERGPNVAWFTDPAGNILSVMQNR
jgi:predicted enzyme related to lactoylglutathione lyase